MSFGRLKTRLKALINRKDLTDVLAGDLVLDAMTELERKLRIGPMEAVFLQKAIWDGTKHAFAIPSTYIELINFFTDEGELDQIDLQTFLRMEDRKTGVPTHFVKVADRFLLKPTPAIGTNVYLHYYGETPRPVDDADETVWSQSCFHATLYTAAALAADYFQMEGDQHADRYRLIAAGYSQAIADQDLDEKWAGRLTIPPPQNIGSDY